MPTRRRMDHDRPEARAESPSLAPSAIAGEATFSGGLSMIDVARDALASHLPPSVTLPRGDSTAYPCLLAFGEQADGATFFGGSPYLGASAITS